VKVFISIFLGLVLFLGFFLDVDTVALQLQDEAYDRAMIAFGLAKGLNAIISLIQGTELSFTPVGVGLNFSVGEVLDPFNDMVERFSWVMLVATISLGIQKLVLLLSAKIFLQVALSLSIVLTLALLWLKKLQNRLVLVFSLRIFFFLFLLRFSAVVFIFLAQFFYTSTLAKDYEEASQVIEKTKSELQEIQTQNKAIVYNQKEESFFTKLNKQYNGLTQSFNISKQLTALQASLSEASEKIITIITIFVVQSILLPLLYFWFILSSFRLIFKSEFKFVSFRVAV